MSTIGLVLGKPAGRSPVIAGVVRELREQGHDVRTHVPSRAANPPAWLHDADLVALRGLGGETLAALASDERAVRFLDAPGALIAVRDRARTAGRLAVAHLATPARGEAATWGDVRQRAAGHGGSLAVKQLDSSVGRGARVWVGQADRLPEQPPFAGPYHLERDVGEGRTEIKLYRVGSHLAGFALTGAASPTEIAIDDRLREIAVRATDALGLSVAGLDLLIDRSSAFIIDVNAFPSCRRLPDAVPRIAGHLAERSCRARGDSLTTTDERQAAS